jgi:hypothetical protein
MKDMIRVVRFTYRVDLDEDVYVWVFEIDLMSWTNNGRNLLYNVHALHDGVVANCRANSKLE